MSKILILANNDMGLLKFRKELIVELLKENEVIIALPNGEFIDQLVNLGCRYIDIAISRRGKNPISDFILIVQYKKLVKKIKPNVVLSYTIKPNIYGGLVCRVMGIPYITNITGLGSAVENKGLLQKLTIILYKLALKKCSCVFFQNNANADFFNRKNILLKKQRLIPGSGVNLEYHTFKQYPNEETINFLFVSRVMKEKGIDQFLEAAKHIKIKYPNTQFHIVGSYEEDYKSKLKDMQEKGIVQYHGKQADVRGFYETSHCIIHPTYYPEGMSNVLLESCAIGRPIITTNRSGCKEIVDDGENGYIVECKNSKDLIEKIEKFLSLSHNEKKEMGINGRRKVEREFDRKIVINAYLDEIRLCLKRI